MNNKIKVRRETYKHGVFEINKEHRCEETHKGFLHKLFCNVEEISEIGYSAIEGWTAEVILYKCGYEVKIQRKRLEDEE